MLDECEISIHALHEESDRTDEATWKTHVISIHALHEESDPTGGVPAKARHTYFNPRSP